MHEIIFDHPEVGSLSVATGADRIAWGYGLNTVTFPTYAGEVVQILSCYIDDLEITGTLRNYREMESIYTYFLRYMQIATQGDPRIAKPVANRTTFNQAPMIMRYPHRGWEFEIIPMTVPGFRYGREVVVPEWRVQAHVVDDAGDAETLKELIIEEAQIKDAIHFSGDGFQENFDLQGVIRFVGDNPFSDPYTKSGLQFATDRADALNKIGDYYGNLLPSYLQGDFSTLVGGLGSSPAFGSDPTKGRGLADSAGALQQQIDTRTGTSGP